MSTGTPSRIPRPLARTSPLPSPPSFEIAAVLAQASGFEDLRSLIAPLSDTGVSTDDESDLENVPPFPKNHQPPIFIIHSHRAQVPFPVRPGVIALGDLHADEQAIRVVLSAPTIPRMNLVMKEQLFMRTWVERLTSQRPPRHVPWTSDGPVPQRNWISEGSIFSAESIKSHNEEMRKTRIAQPRRVQNGPSKDTAHSTPHTPPIRNHREAAVISKESPGCQPVYKQRSVHVPTACIKQRMLASGPRTPIRERTEKRVQRSSGSLTQKSCSDKTTISTRQLASPRCKISRPSPQISSHSLAIRRGKNISGLQLKEVDDMEYPDIPTAFRGSPTIWSPNFDPGVYNPNEKLFTDHRSMLSSLRSQCATLTSGISTPGTYGSKEWQAVSTESDTDSVPSMTSVSTNDEWGFEKDLDVFTADREPIDNVPDVPLPSFTLKCAPDRPKNSLSSTPDRCSTRTCTTCFGSPPLPRSTVPHVKDSPVPLTGPPCSPLPPRPVLINPSTPPRVRGILKKAKSVRFEDVGRSQIGSLLVTPTQESSTTANRPSPLRHSFIAPVDDHLSAATANEPADTEIEAEAIAPQPKANQELSIKRPHMTKSKLVPKGTILSSHRVYQVPILKAVDTNVHREVLPALECNEPATSTLGRHNRVASVDKENERNEPATSTLGRQNRVASVDKENERIALVRGRKRWSTMNENDLRNGVEGSAPRSRLTMPLRNIFKFK